MRRVQSRVSYELGELVPLVRIANLLQGDQTGGEALQLSVQLAGAPLVALVVLHVDGQDSQAHRSVFDRVSVGLGAERKGQFVQPTRGNLAVDGQLHGSAPREH